MSCRFYDGENMEWKSNKALPEPKYIMGEPKLKDTGNRREHESGAVRDSSKGKGRMDLMPLRVVARLMSNSVLGHIGAYMESGNTNEIDSAIKEFVYNGKLLPFEDRSPEMADMMIAVGKHFEKGAEKYKPRNWEAGLPISWYIDSGVRHYLKHLRGDDDEPHGVAFVWNMLCLIWTHHHRPECIDVNFKEV